MSLPTRNPTLHQTAPAHRRSADHSPPISRSPRPRRQDQYDECRGYSEGRLNSEDEKQQMASKATEVVDASKVENQLTVKRSQSIFRRGSSKAETMENTNKAVYERYHKEVFHLL
jgi:hypothetical protein